MTKVKPLVSAVLKTLDQEFGDEEICSRTAEKCWIYGPRESVSSHVAEMRHLTTPF